MVFGSERSINPILLQERKEVGGLLKIHVFDEKGIGAQLVGTVDVAEEVGGGEDDHRQTPDSILLPDPGKNIVTVDAWKLQVKEHERRERVFCPVLVFAFAGQVSNGFLTGAHHLEGNGHTAPSEGSSDQEDVILQILNQQNEVTV